MSWAMKSVGGYIGRLLRITTHTECYSCPLNRIGDGSRLLSNIGGLWPPKRVLCIGSAIRGRLAESIARIAWVRGV